MGNWALVIGCDAYWDPKACLRGAVRDALAMRSWLLDKSKGGVPKQNLQVLLGSRPEGAPVPSDVKAGPPTRDEIVLAINLLLQRSAGDEGRLFVFFAGHGLTARVNGIDEPAIVPTDFTSELTSKAIAISSIVEQLATSSLREQFFFFDACRNIPFEGEFFISPLDRPRQRDYTKAAPNQYGCFATSPGLKSHETSTQGDERGAFTDALLRGLAGDATAKLWDPDSEAYVVRFDELFAFVEGDVAARELGDDHLFQRPRRLVDAGSDNPVLATFADGSFVDAELEIAVDPEEAAATATVSVADLFDSTVYEPPVPKPFKVPRQPRTYSVRGSAPGFVPKRRAWPVSLYTPQRVVIVFEPAPVGTPPDAPPEFTRPLRGAAGVPETGKLLVHSSDPLAMVEAAGESGAIQSGVGELQIVHAGRYRVWARNPSGGGEVKFLEVEPGDDDEIEVEPPPLPAPIVHDYVAGADWWWLDEAASDIDPGWGQQLKDAIGRGIVPALSTMFNLAASFSLSALAVSPDLGRLGVDFGDTDLSSGWTGVLLVVVDHGTASGELPPITAALHDATGAAPEGVPLQQGTTARVATLALAGEPGPARLALTGIGPNKVIVAVYLEHDRPVTVTVELENGRRPVVYQHGRPLPGSRDGFRPATVWADDAAERFARQGNTADALALLDKVGPGSLPAAALHGYLLVATGAEPDRVLAVASQLAEWAPDLPDAHILRALGEARLGDLAAAAASARQAAELGMPLIDAGLLGLVDLMRQPDAEGHVDDADDAKWAGTAARRVPGQLFTTWIDEPQTES